MVENTYRRPDVESESETAAEDAWFEQHDSEAVRGDDAPTIGHTPAWSEASARAEDSTAASIRAEQERLAAERQARREARQAALNPPAPQVVPVAALPTASAPAQAPAKAPARGAQRTTDRFLPSFGLFALRLVTAAIMGIHGVNKLLDPQSAADVFANTILPRPQLLALVTGGAEVAIAIALVFGLLTRLAGLGVALVAGGTLAFVMWGPWSPFIPGEPGFLGELELLLAAVGVLFVTVGAGGWSLDRGFRARRAADRAAREAA